MTDDLWFWALVIVFGAAGFLAAAWKFFENERKIMAESGFNKRFRRELTNYGFRFDRLESHSTAPGIPDNHSLFPNGVTAFMEMKQSVSVWPRKVDYRPMQVPWLMGFAEAGGNCFTCLHILKSDSLIIIRGEHSSLASQNITDCPLEAFDLKQPGEWRKVAQFLVDESTKKTNGRLRRLPKFFA